MLDLVDERRDPAVDEPVVEGTRARAADRRRRRQVRGRGERLVTARGTAPRGRSSSSGRGCRPRAAVEDARRARSMPASRARSPRACPERRGSCDSCHAPLVLDPGRKGEGVVGPPGRGREVAVEVDAGGVLPRAVQEPSGLATGRWPSSTPRRARAPAGGARGAPSLPPRRAGLRGAIRRARSPRQEHPQRNAVTGASVLLHAPAVEDVPGGRGHRGQLPSTGRTSTATPSIETTSTVTPTSIGVSSPVSRRRRPTVTPLSASAAWAAARRASGTRYGEHET